MESPKEIIKTISPELFVELKAQIIKDFNSCGINGINEEHLNLMLLLENITHVIKSLNSTQPQRLKSLIYRIDIPENVVRKLYGTNLIENFESALALAILKRELQKVVLRRGSTY